MYSGELIGVEYLFWQTDKVLGKYTPDDAEGDGDDDESFDEDDTIPDLTIPPIDGSRDSSSPPPAEASRKESEWTVLTIQLSKSL